MNKFYYISISILSLLLTLGCSKHDSNEVSVRTTIKIAVILPQESYDRWIRIMNLSQKNISEATDISPVFDFYDEDNNDMMTLAYQLSRDASIDCIIGCMSEENTDVLAYQMSRLKIKKPMFTFNTSQDVIRKYTRMGFMWGLSETDITQCEIILANIAQNNSYSEVALLTNKSSYGQTFLDWFAFQATELGLKPTKTLTYDSIEDIPSKSQELSALNCPVVCVPDAPAEAAEMIKNIKNGYFSHKAFSNKTLEILKNTTVPLGHSMQGVTMVADPQSGFDDIYIAKYGESSIFGEAQLYDAILISCLAKAIAKEFDITLNKAVSDLLSADSKHFGGWTTDAIRWSYKQIVDEHLIPETSGAIGKWTFSPEKHTNINVSTYAIQYLGNSEFYKTDYVSRVGDGGSSSIQSAWIWNKILNEDFDFEQEDYDLPPCLGNKAVLIAGSKGWDNYRHQADILAYYQLLKKNDFTDDDIILIIADDLLFNTKNPYPGLMVRDEKSLENIYVDVEVDYTLDQITPNDLKDILLGKSSEKLPTVLNSSINENVLLIWSGHGKQNTLIWDDNQVSVTGKFMSDIFNEMYSNGKYRKLFGIIEACYGGSVAAACSGIPRLLLMTAANEKETSKAENYSAILGTYLTNSFTSSVLSTMGDSSKIGISIRDLYIETYINTMGSHATLYNTNLFGNIYLNYAHDYFTRVY